MSAKGKRRTRRGAQERPDADAAPGRHRRDAPALDAQTIGRGFSKLEKIPVDKQTSNLQNTHLRVVLMRSAYHVGM